MNIRDILKWWHDCRLATERKQMPVEIAAYFVRAGESEDESAPGRDLSPRGRRQARDAAELIRQRTGEGEKIVIYTDQSPHRSKTARIMSSAMGAQSLFYPQTSLLNYLISPFHVGEDKPYIGYDYFGEQVQKIRPKAIVLVLPEMHIRSVFPDRFIAPGSIHALKVVYQEKRIRFSEEVPVEETKL